MIALDNRKTRVIRRSLAIVSLIAVALYYFRFSLRPDGMTLFPQGAACMLKRLPMNDCSPTFTYPPLFAFLMIPFTVLPMWARNLSWYAVLLSVTYGSFRLSERLVCRTLNTPLIKQNLTGFRVLSVVLVLNFVLAVFENQAYDVLVLFFLLLALTGLVEGKPSWSLVGFGLAAALKATPLLFFPYILYRKGWKLFALCIVCYLGLSLLPDVFFRVEGDQHATYYGNWIRQVALQPFIEKNSGGMPRFWEGENPLNQSLRPFVLRIALTLGLQHYFRPILYGVYALCLVSALWVFSRSVKLPAPPVWDGSLLMIGMLLLSPMSSKSHFVVLMLPFMIVAAHLITEPALRGRLGLAACLSCALNNFTSKDLVGRQMATMMGYWGSVTMGTIVLAIGLGYLVNVEAKRLECAQRDLRR